MIKANNSNPVSESIIYEKLAKSFKIIKEEYPEYDLIAACCIGDYNVWYNIDQSKIKVWCIIKPKAEAIVDGITTIVEDQRNDFIITDFRHFLELLQYNPMSFEALISQYKIVTNDWFYDIIKMAQPTYQLYRCKYIQNLLGLAQTNLEFAKLNIKIGKYNYHLALRDSHIAYKMCFEEDCYKCYEDIRQQASSYIRLFEKEITSELIKTIDVFLKVTRDKYKILEKQFYDDIC